MRVPPSLTDLRGLIVLTSEGRSDGPILLTEYTPHKAVTSQVVIVVEEVLCPGYGAVTQESSNSISIRESSTPNPV